MPARIERDIESGLMLIEANGEWRALACLPPHKLCALPPWELGNPVLQANQLQEIALDELWDTKVNQQHKTNACVGHAVDVAFTIAWLQAGGDPREFSPTWLYGLINGGQDRGSVVSDALTAIKMYGICEEKFVGADKIYRQQFPSEAYGNARRFRVIEAYQVRNFAQLCTAISLGFPVVSGIYIGDNFSDLDADGIAPLPDQVIGGHALCHVGLKYSKKRGLWLVRTRNSWGKEWGFQNSIGRGGLCYLTEAHWARMNLDAWAICGVFRDPEDADSAIPSAKKLGVSEPKPTISLPTPAETVAVAAPVNDKTLDRVIVARDAGKAKENKS